MSWFNRLFGKCCDDCTCGDEKQEMTPTEPVSEPESETPSEPEIGDETPTME